MLTGSVPFQGSHAEAIAYAVRNETPAPIRASRPDVAEEIEHLVFRADAQRAGDPICERPRAIARAATGARPFDSSRFPHRASGRAEATAADGKRRRWKIWAAAAAVVVVAVGRWTRVPVTCCGTANPHRHRPGRQSNRVRGPGSVSACVDAGTHHGPVRVAKRSCVVVSASAPDRSSIHRERHGCLEPRCDPGRDDVWRTSIRRASCARLRGGAMACARRDSGCVNLNDGGSRRDRCRVVVDRQGHRVYADWARLRRSFRSTSGPPAQGSRMPCAARLHDCVRWTPSRPSKRGSVLSVSSSTRLLRVRSCRPENRTRAVRCRLRG